ncbi:hypothetical protein [Anaerophilus nitritogenes]|uniref:hypothetical protein n=1 Tax=Anaerophilus nitritogenes TaxID=2498136 RepID=UPI0019310031|nr:hypothetical protein [Anaerophilus nitritogenes]
MQGWIKVHRCIKKNWLWQDKPFSKGQAWIDLIMMMNHEDRKVLIGNELILVERGSRITSIRKLCDRWGWSNTKLKNFLKILENDGMLIVKSDTKKTIITVVNYNDYQSKDDSKNDAEATDERHESDTKATRKHTNKNVKNYKNEKNDKEDIKDIVELKFNEESIQYRLANYLKKYILKNNPKARVPGLKDMDKWSIHIDRLIRLDGRTDEEVKKVIQWCQKDSFWMTNILSTQKLRKNFDTLFLQMNNERSKKSNGKGKQFETNTEKIIDSVDAVKRFLEMEDEDG